MLFTQAGVQGEAGRAEAGLGGGAMDPSRLRWGGVGKGARSGGDTFILLAIWGMGRPSCRASARRFSACSCLAKGENVGVRVVSEVCWEAKVWHCHKTKKQT